MSLSCSEQIARLQRLKLLQALLVVLIRKAKTTQLCTSFGALTRGLGRVGQVTTEFGSSQVKIGRIDAVLEQLGPAGHQQLQRECGAVHPGGSMHHKRCSAGSRGVMHADVVGHTMFFSKPAEQQAGHAGSQVRLQEPQRQVIGMAVGQGCLPQHQHHLFRRQGLNTDGRSITLT